MGGIFSSPKGPDVPRAPDEKLAADQAERRRRAELGRFGPSGTILTDKQRPVAELIGMRRLGTESVLGATGGGTPKKRATWRARGSSSIGASSYA